MQYPYVWCAQKGIGELTEGVGWQAANGFGSGMEERGRGRKVRERRRNRGSEKEKALINTTPFLFVLPGESTNTEALPVPTKAGVAT